KNEGRHKEGEEFGVASCFCDCFARKTLSFKWANSENGSEGRLPHGLFFCRCSHGSMKIENEAFVFALARLLVGLPKQRGWVNRCENFWRELRRQHFAALACNAKQRPENGLRGSRAEADQSLRFHQTQLGLKPRMAGRDLA